MAVPTKAGNAFCAQQGMAYLYLLFAVAALSLGLALTGSLWTIEKRREQEVQLQFAAQQYCQAIKLYYLSTPGTQKRYPQTLDELLLDNRFVVPRRHLRKRYPDPITQKPDWGLLRGSDNGIVGLYSLSETKPLKQSPDPYVSYREWKFDCQVVAPSSGKQ